VGQIFSCAAFTDIQEGRGRTKLKGTQLTVTYADNPYVENKQSKDEMKILVAVEKWIPSLSGISINGRLP
jgi:hypothetical protein